MGSPLTRPLATLSSTGRGEQKQTTMIVHLATSPFFGGPEMQILGQMQSLPDSVARAALLFPDRGKSRVFRQELIDRGEEAITLASDTPDLPAMVREVTRQLRQRKADILCCHGYKADVVGLLAARRAGVPVIAISHGWTAETWKVRVYEALDRVCLRRMDRVVCVSAGQAVKVRKAGVKDDRVVVIRNAIQADRFAEIDPADRGRLEAMFPRSVQQIVGSAGRLSLEKGFGVLVEAAAIVTRSRALSDSSISGMVRCGRPSRGESPNSGSTSNSSWPGSGLTSIGSCRTGIFRSCHRSPRVYPTLCWRPSRRVFPWWRPPSAGSPRLSRIAKAAILCRQATPRPWRAVSFLP